MRISKLPPYRLSDFRPQHLNLRDGEVQTLKCPECESWRSISRGALTPHYPEPQKRCSGSARRIIFDITVEQWGAALVEGEREAGARRSRQQFHKPAPPAGQPVHRMAYTAQMSPLERARQAIARHQASCKNCRNCVPCRMPKVLAEREAGRSGLAALERAHAAVARHRRGCAECRHGHYCPLGYELAERKSWTEQTRESVTSQQTREQQEERSRERGREGQQSRRRVQQWRQALPAVERTDRERREQLLRQDQLQGPHRRFKAGPVRQTPIAKGRNAS
ncbi:hypothetical protein [Streptomyces sp. NPDC004533]|uniref:hypothetical protein n=1 Tax=Streptomyces sp. NPDC004533 TaxID=3154278 RepID=UPI0033B6A090